MDSPDPDVEIILCNKKGQLFAESDVKVELSPTYFRKKLSEELERSIDLIWSARLEKNPRLWNGTKFRLYSLTQTDGEVLFKLGITCYKDFLGTNWSQHVAEIAKFGSEHYSSSQSCMSGIFGVGSLVETSDNKLILMRRSEYCGEAVGQLDVPGGHPEPKELVGNLDISEIDVTKMSPGEVVRELFHSIKQEIIDEVNIPAEELTEPSLMGVMRNTTCGGRPVAQFYTKCSLTSREVLSLYTVGGSEAAESTDIKFIPVADVANLQTRDIWAEITPSAKSCFIMFGNYRQDS